MAQTLVESTHLRLVDEGPDIGVIFVCASQDTEALRCAMSRIEVPRWELLPGIEHGIGELRTAVTAGPRPTLFVVCRTPHLDPAHARRAVECFGVRRPFHHRLLVIEFDPRRPGAWSSTVRRAYGAMREALTIATSPVEGMVDSGDRSAVRGETLIDAHAQDGSGRPTASRRGQRVVVGDAADTHPDFWRDEVGPIPAHVRAPVTRRRVALASTPETPDQDEAASVSDAELPCASQVVPQVVAARRGGGALEAVEPAGDPGRIAAVLAVVMVVLAFAAVPMLAASSGAREPDSMPQARDADVAIADAEVPSATPPSRAASAVGSSRGAADLAARSDAPAVADSAPLAAATAVARLGAPVTADAPLEVFLGPGESVDWYAAANDCRARNRPGQPSVRLPSLDELRSLRRVGAVPVMPAVWSGTRVHGERGRNWVLVGRGSQATMDKREDTAHIVCVRGR